MGVFKIAQLLDGDTNNVVITGGLVPKGAYDNGTDYAVGDSVDYLGSSYVMFVNATAGTLPTDTTKWQVIANKGATGATGATGAAGATGATGQGVPTGGTTGQALVKASNTNYDTAWSSAGAGDMTAAVYDPQAIVGDAFDQDNMTDGTTNKNYTATEETKLAGIETSADVTDAGNVGSSIHGATAKTTPVDADTMPLIDSAASNVLKKVTWANVKAILKSYFDTLYQAVGSYITASSTDTLTNKTIDANGTGNNISNIEVADLATGVLDADLTSVAGTDTTIPSAKATKTALDLKAPLASPTFTGIVTLPTGLTGVVRTDSGVVSVDTDVTDIVAAASTIAAGKVELATDAETNTGTDTGRAITPSNLEAWEGSAQVTTVGTLATGNATGIVSAASDITAGKVELATTAETETGTDTGRAVTPDGLHDMATLAGAGWFLDEDDMVSNSAVKTSSQQAIKAYVDANSGGTVDTANTPNANEYARFTDADTIEGRTEAEFKADMNLEIGTDVQAYSANLDEYAAVNPTAAGLALLDDLDASAQRTTLGLVIGTNVQAYDAELAAVAGLTSAADKGIQFTGAGTAGTYDLTTAGKALLDDANAAAQLVTLGVTSTAAELNILDGATLDVTELNYVDGVTSAIQTQLDAKVAKSTYDAHTVLYATTDNTPVALTVGEQTVVGRATGGNIAAIAIDSDLSSVSGSDDTIPSAKATKAMGDLKLPLAGGTMSGNITLGENTSVALDPAGSADGKYSGITVTGTGGATIAFGDLVTLDKDDSRWELVDISVAAAATGDARGLLGIAVTSSSDGGALTILLHGIIRADANFPALTIGAPVYASTTGDVVVAQPTTTDHVIRIVGYAMTADELYFNPGNTWTTHT